MREENQKEHEFLYREFPVSVGQQAIRMEKWKGIRKNIFKEGLQMQLYNLKEDIQEQTNVSAQHPDIVQKIEDIFAREHTPAEIERFKIKQLGD